MSITICDTHLVRTVRYLSLTFEPVYMLMYSAYKVKIKHYNHIFKDTISICCTAVDYLMRVYLENWNSII